jgi:hypothetical protein
MAYSVAQYTGDGVNTQFAVPFPVLSRDHLRVFVGGIESAFLWLSDGMISVIPAPGLGTAVELRRDSSRDVPMVDFTDGSVLTENDLETANLQALYVAQEAFDAADENVMSAQIEAWASQAEMSALSAVASAADAASSANAAEGHAINAAASAATASAAASLAGTKLDKLLDNAVNPAFRITSDANQTYDKETNTVAATHYHAPSGLILSATGKKQAWMRAIQTIAPVAGSALHIDKINITQDATAAASSWEVFGRDLHYKIDKPLPGGGDFYGHRVTFEGPGYAWNLYGFEANFTGSVQASANKVGYRTYASGSVLVDRGFRVEGDGTGGPSVNRGFAVEDTITVAGAAFQWSVKSGTGGLFLNLLNTSARFTVDYAGDMTFGGTGRRIKAPLSDATHADRAMFQTTAVDSITNVGAIPSGTAVGSSFNTYNSSAPNNAGTFGFGINATEAFLASTKTGIGSTRPLKILMDGTERFRIDTLGRVAALGYTPASLEAAFTVAHSNAGNPATFGSTDANLAFRIDVQSVGVDFGVYGSGAAWIQPRLKSALGTTFGLTLCPAGGTVATGGHFNPNGNVIFNGLGRRIIADMSDALHANRFAIQNATLNGNTIMGLIPNGTSVISAIRLFGTSDPDAANSNAALLAMNLVTNTVTLGGYKSGTGVLNGVELQYNATTGCGVDANNFFGVAMSKAGAPTTTEIPAGRFRVVKDTSGGTVKLFYNDGGVLKSVALV